MGYAGVGEESKVLSYEEAVTQSWFVVRCGDIGGLLHTIRISIILPPSKALSPSSQRSSHFGSGGSPPAMWGTPGRQQGASDRRCRGPRAASWESVTAAG